MAETSFAERCEPEVHASLIAEVFRSPFVATNQRSRDQCVNGTVATALRPQQDVDVTCSTWSKKIREGECQCCVSSVANALKGSISRTITIDRNRLPRSPRAANMRL